MAVKSANNGYRCFLNNFVADSFYTALIIDLLPLKRENCIKIPWPNFIARRCYSHDVGISENPVINIG